MYRLEGGMKQAKRTHHVCHRRHITLRKKGGMKHLNRALLGSSTFRRTVVRVRAEAFVGAVHCERGVVVGGAVRVVSGLEKGLGD